MSEIRVTVVVPVRNAGRGICELLDALAAQDLPASEREVVVVDDASTDETRRLAERHGTATVLATARWSGAYLARNLGIDVARGAVVAFTDADCRPRTTWLRAALEELDVLGADVLAGEVDVRPSARPGIVELVDFCRYLDQRRAIDEAGFGATANLIVRRSVLDELGRFNPHVISDGDRDLCLRARRAGRTVLYSPRPVVAHEPRRRAYDLARRGFRDGIARAQMRRFAPDFPAALPQIWRRPGPYVPSALLGRSEIYGIERLASAGVHVSARQRAGMALAEWALVQLPMVAGNLVGAARTRRRRWRRRGSGVHGAGRYDDHAG